VTLPLATGGLPPVLGPYATQPWNRVIWPGDPLSGVLPTPLVWDTSTARKIPGVARALGIYGGMSKQMRLNAFRGSAPLPRPRVLDQPDPNRGRGWFTQVHVEDYLLNGNALTLVTSRDATGLPSTLMWIPAQWCYLIWYPDDPATLHYALTWRPDVYLPPEDVIHVRRGADPWCPARGIGVVAEMLRTLDRAAREEDYERNTLAGAAVPSVAVTTPNPRLSQEEADAGKLTWMEKYGGQGRAPGIFPAGTIVTPLSWSPADSELTAARQATLTDLANAFNLDGYWLGAPGSSMTYRSPGSMYTNLLRVSLEPVVSDFEDVWSAAILPRGQRVVFDRAQLVHDDQSTTITTLTQAVNAGLYTRDEARLYMGLPALGDAIPQVGPMPAPVATVDEQAVIDADSASATDDPSPDVQPEA
jgi:HK97 family phage portal protein